MPKNYAPPECDVVVLAGDIGTGISGIAWAAEAYPRDLPIIYLAGNHEMYGHSLNLYAELAETAAETPNIHFLENNTVEIGGAAFIGATLWTDFNLYGNDIRGGISAYCGMNDFRRIGGLTLDAWREMHAASRTYLRAALEAHRRQPCVVVTHHAPHEMSVPERFQGDSLTPAFASHVLNDIPEPLRPALWLHGHTHDSFDYAVGETRVVCNPRGYVGHELNPYFNIERTIELETK